MVRCKVSDLLQPEHTFSLPHTHRHRGVSFRSLQCARAGASFQTSRLRPSGHARCRGRACLGRLSIGNGPRCSRRERAVGVHEFVLGRRARSDAVVTGRCSGAELGRLNDGFFGRPCRWRRRFRRAPGTRQNSAFGELPLCPLEVEPIGCIRGNDESGGRTHPAAIGGPAPQRGGAVTEL